MSGIISQLQNPILDFLSADEIALLKRTMLSKFAEDEQESFVRLCQRTRLDPFTKQVYATKRYQKERQNGEYKKVPVLVPVTGIQGLTAVADRSGQYDGCEIHWCGPDGVWKEEWLSLDPPAAARCKVYHKNRHRPEVAIARWDGYAATQWDNDSKRWILTDFWQRMPDYMLGKCAKAAALRGAFPDQLSNLYIREELDSQITEADAESAADIAAERLKEARDKAQLAADLRDEKSAHSAPQSVLGPATPPPQQPPRDEGDIDFGPSGVLPPPAQWPTQPAPPPPPLSVVPSVSAETQTEVQTAVAESAPDPTWWKEHVIRGVEHPRFKGKKIGELQKAEMSMIELQWIPAVREGWEDATDLQRDDFKAFEAAVAFYQIQRPW